MMKIIKWIKQFVKWIRYRLRKKYKRLYQVYDADAKEHYNLQLRGLPKAGTSVILKGKTPEVMAAHYEVQVLNVFKLNTQQKRKARITSYVDAYHVDGRYNDLKIKRLS